MDFFICIGFCICVIIALIGYYIAHVVKQVKKGDDEMKLLRQINLKSEQSLKYQLLMLK